MAKSTRASIMRVLLAATAMMGLLTAKQASADCCAYSTDIRLTKQDTGATGRECEPLFNQIKDTTSDAVAACSGLDVSFWPTGVIPARLASDGGTLFDTVTCEQCTNCCPDASGCGDPHITGFDGSSYLLYGRPNTTYSLISERDHQVNIRLYHPPTLTDSHALYIDAVGIMIRGSRIAARLVPGSPATMMLSVNNGPEVAYRSKPAERAIDARTSYLFAAPDRVTITSSDLTFSVRLVDNDHFDVGVDEVAAHWRNVHGVMGQTHAAAFRAIKFSYAKGGQAVGALPGKADAKKTLQLQGSEDDYVVSSLFGTDSKFNRFGRAVATRKLLLASAADTAAAASGAKLASAAGVSMMTDAGVRKVAAPHRHLLAPSTYWWCPT